MPETCYAKNGDVYIAYQVSGSEPIDLIFIPGFVSHLEFQWEEPMLAHLFNRLASFSRLIRFDKRGTGLSDRVKSGTLEDRMEDLLAVMDTVGSKQAALLGVSEGGPLGISLAATHPDRVLSLILWNTFPRYRCASDYPQGFTPDIIEMFINLIKNKWGHGAVISSFAAPSANKSVIEWWGKCERLAMSPGDALIGFEWYSDIDVRKILPVIDIPTMVIHSAYDALVPPEHSHYMAKHIKGAKLVELRGKDHFAYSEWDKAIGEMEEFLTGNRSASEPKRMLATVLFTDIIGSTKLASKLGDHQWCKLLNSHNAIVRKELERFQGFEVDNIGDGFFATFDGPTRAVYCACSIRENLRSLGIKVRAGLHAGEVEKAGEKIAGIAVNIGAHVSAIANEDEILVSSTIKDLVVGSKLYFDEYGDISIEGMSEKIKLYRVDGAKIA